MSKCPCLQSGFQQESHLYYSSLWGWWGTGTCCPEELWLPPPWNCSTPRLEQQHLVAGVPAHGRGIGTRQSLRSFPTQTILWWWFYIWCFSTDLSDTTKNIFIKYSDSTIYGRKGSVLEDSRWSKWSFDKLEKRSKKFYWQDVSSTLNFYTSFFLPC